MTNHYTDESVNTILAAEDARLAAKEASIKSAKTSKQRLISMNDNYSKRMQEYTKIMIVAVISLLLILGITLLKKRIPGAPDGLFLVITIIILSAAAIYCLIIYKNIVNRDPNNFDEINPDSPVVLSQAEINKALRESKNSGDLTGSVNLGGCVGQSCCDETANSGYKTIWDAPNQKCKTVSTTTSISAFTTLAEAIGEYSNKKDAGIIAPKTKAFDEWEYTEYMKI